MARRDQVTGKGRLRKRKVSHSNIKTMTHSDANAQWRRLFDPISGRFVRLKVTPATLRTIDKKGKGGVAWALAQARSR